MRHLLARLILAAGFLLAAWHFWFTPATLIGVRILDLRGEYLERAQRLARRQPIPEPQALSQAADAHRRKVLSSRPLHPLPALPTPWLDAVQLGIAGSGPFQQHKAGRLLYFRADAPPLDLVTGPLRRSLGETGFLNAYATVGSRDLEFMIFPEPHSADAPTAVMYPHRSQALVWVAAGLLLYGAIGWPLRRGVHFDPLPTVVLDLLAAAGAAFLFGLPLWISPSTAAALGDVPGGTLWFWGFALLPLLGLLRLAGRAAWRIDVSPEGLEFRTLLRRRAIPWHGVTAAELAETLTPPAGVVLYLDSGETLRIPWTGTVGFLHLIRSLQRFGPLRLAQGREFKEAWMLRTAFSLILLAALTAPLSFARDVAKDQEFRVRLTAPISTETNQKGDKISAMVVAPEEFQGAVMEGEIKESKSGNKFKGKSTLLFTFHTLTPRKEEPIPVSTDVKSFVNSQGKANVDEEGFVVEKKNNLGKVAIGSGAGALLGAMIGGGKGAAIGAGIGAGASLIVVQIGSKAPNIRFDPGAEIVLSVNPRREGGK
jgi:hypothetical protein